MVIASLGTENNFVKNIRAFWNYQTNTDKLYWNFHNVVQIQNARNSYKSYLPFVAQQPKWGLGRLNDEVSRSHKIRHTHARAVGLLWTGDRLIAESTALNEINIHALSGIRTRDPRNRCSPGLGLRPHGHWNQLQIILYIYIYIK